MLNFTFNDLDTARKTRAGLGNFLAALKDVSRDKEANPDIPALIETARAGFAGALEDDLNISEALASLFHFVSTVNTLISSESISQKEARQVLEFYASLDEVLAISPAPKSAQGNVIAHGRASGQALVLPGEIKEKIDARQKARAEKNFAIADAIRRELLAQGYMLEDTKDDVLWKKVEPSKS
jgi:cysteinyl-tRNA synthetase